MSHDDRNEREVGKAVCLSVRVDGEEDAARELAERICAEVFDVGALGIEETVESGGIMLSIYTGEAALGAVKNAAAAVLGDAGKLGPICEIVEQDWSQDWKKGLEPIEVSSRLVVRPSFVEFELGKRQLELIIDPRQAFGTGGHASTFLALEWIDALADGFHAGTQVLDVGTGTGVLALAALKLGAGRAVGLDIDPIAIVEADHWARENGLADRFVGAAGGIEVISEGNFDLVVANLLRLEMLPLVASMVARLGEAGQIVLSGLLAHEQTEVGAAFLLEDVVLQDVRSEIDGNGDEWVSLLMIRA